MRNAISWFEIPTTDIDRAQKFYEAIFDCTLVPMDLPEIKMRMFPLDDMMSVGGAIVDSGGFHKPSATDGTLIYLNGNPDVQRVLARLRPPAEKLWCPKQRLRPNMATWLFLSTPRATASDCILFLHT